jgi:hypothetical protein
LLEKYLVDEGITQVIWYDSRVPNCKLNFNVDKSLLFM